MFTTRSDYTINRKTTKLMNVSNEDVLKIILLEGIEKLCDKFNNDDAIENVVL